MFHLVSLSLQISLVDLPCLVLWLVCGCCLFCFVFVLCWFFSSGKFDFNLSPIPVVDRPCLALVRQCRKKNQSQAAPPFMCKPGVVKRCRHDLVSRTQYTLAILNTTVQLSASEAFEQIVQSEPRYALEVAKKVVKARKADRSGGSRAETEANVLRWNFQC